MSKPEKSLTSLRVLYLEDEPLIAMDVTDCLEELGVAEIAAVHRLAKAEAALEVGEFDLAILDINVDQGQSSISLGQRVAQMGVPVIFASGNGCDAEELRKEGHRFISKPFTHKRLKDEIVGVLNSAA